MNINVLTDEDDHMTIGVQQYQWTSSEKPFLNNVKGVG